MKHISRKEQENYEVAGILREKGIHNGKIVRLWLANKNELIEDWLAEESGYYIQIRTDSMGVTESCNTTNLIEACKAFNEVCQAIL